MPEPIEWGQGEYYAEQDLPLADWFKGQNLERKIVVEVASDADLFGTKQNAMLAIRHLTRKRVIHVPLGEAIAAGLPQWFVPRELRVREKHVHRCCWCKAVEHCRDEDCFGDANARFNCRVCDARNAVESAEAQLRHKQHRQPGLWESPESITREIASAKAAVTRAKRRLEELTVNANV